MPENPYESPKGMEEPSPAARRRFVSLIPLSCVAVPVAAMAGSATYLVGPSFVGLLRSFAGGMAVMIAVLMAANSWRPRRSSGRSFLNAGAGLAVSTPFALIVGVGLGFLAYDVSSAGGDGLPYGIAMVFIPFFLWSLGFWIGLQWGAKQEQATR